jgi:hypothetical protein
MWTYLKTSSFINPLPGYVEDKRMLLAKRCYLEEVARRQTPASVHGLGGAAAASSLLAVPPHLLSQ